MHLPTVASCPDCPAARLGVFAELVGATKSECAFHMAAVEARAFLPAAWSDTHALGLVRRGVLIRQRADGSGQAIAIDAAGPGCVFPFEPRDPSGHEVPSDYAATELLVCLLPRETLERAIESSSVVSRDVISMQLAALHRVERLARARGAASVRGRVASLLTVLADTLSPPRRRERLPAGLQQRDLARLVGVRHETFCRVLGELEREGAVRRDTDGIVLVDRERLDRIACE